MVGSQVYGREIAGESCSSAASPDEDVALIENEGKKKIPHAEASQAGVTASPEQLTLNLIVGGLGTGIFTLPWSTAGASVIPACAIVALTLLVNVWTISILVEAAERHQTFDLGGLLGRLPGGLGRVAQATCNVAVWLSMFLCLVGYTIVIAGCIQSSMPLPTTGILSKRPTIILLCSMALFPLCFLDQRRLSFTSVMGVVVFGNLFVFLVSSFVREEQNLNAPPVCYFGISKGSVAMLSAMMQAVIVQMCVLPMYAEMTDRTPAKFNKVVAVSFSALFLIFSGYAAFGYLAFGSDVKSDILLSLPHNFWGQASRIAAGLGVAAVYPIMMTPMIAPIRNSDFGANFGLDREVFAKGCTIFIIANVTHIALYATDLGFLNVVNGALSLGLFVALAPGLIGLNLLGGKSQHPGWRLAMYALMFCGVIFSILGLIFTDNFSVDLRAACKWASAIDLDAQANRLG